MQNYKNISLKMQQTFDKNIYFAIESNERHRHYH